MARIVLLMLGLSLLVHGQDVREALLRCGRIADDLERLAAFDQVARESAEGKVQVPEVARAAEMEVYKKMFQRWEGVWDFPSLSRPLPDQPDIDPAVGPFGVDLAEIPDDGEVGKWRTVSLRSPMDDNPIYLAYLYSGQPDRPPWLGIQYGEGEFRLYVCCGTCLAIETIEVAYRVGKGEVGKLNWVVSKNSQTMFYPEDSRRFLGQLAREPSLVLRFAPIAQDARTVVFDLRGLHTVLRGMAAAMERDRQALD